MMADGVLHASIVVLFCAGLVSVIFGLRRWSAGRGSLLLWASIAWLVLTILFWIWLRTPAPVR
jgi:hypothetical protein